jgi:hypothetical protein
MGADKGKLYFAALVFYETPETYGQQTCFDDETSRATHAEYLGVLQAICKTFENNQIVTYLVDFDAEAYRAWREREYPTRPDTTQLRTEWAYQMFRSAHKMPELVIEQWRKRLGVLPR